MFFGAGLDKFGPKPLTVHKQTKMAAKSKGNLSKIYDMEAVLELLDNGFFDNDEEIEAEVKGLESEVSRLLLNLFFGVDFFKTTNYSLTNNAI